MPHSCQFSHIIVSVVASDLTLGGFCHSWGEDQPKVQKKKRMLEDEGIRFETNGKKILKQYFVGNEKEESKVRFAKQRKEEKAINQQPATASTLNNSVSKTSTIVDEITEEMLKKEILDLLNKRALGKTCWPSEIPRALSKRGELSPGVDWRSLMEPTRVAARSLVNSGKVDVMQKGNVLSKEQEYRGPIRLRLHIPKKDH